MPVFRFFVTLLPEDVDETRPYVNPTNAIFKEAFEKLPAKFAEYWLVPHE